MKKHLLLIVFFLGSFIAQAQTPSMTVSTTGNNKNPFWLAENIFVDPNFNIFQPLGPTGVPITQPSTVQVGRFWANDTTFPIDSGIVMAACNVNTVITTTPGPNGNNVTFTDAELASVLSTIGSSSSTIKDVATIQFSFLAPTDTIEFNFVFASHEYASYTCSSFNDVFGFFLEGPFIDGVTAPVGQTTTKNLAVIPGTTVPVAVNTINQGFPSGSNNASNCTSANPNYVAHSVMYNSSNGSIISMGGYSDKFTARAQVQCGGWYTIRLKIANVSDHQLSSAVFLEQGSFRIPTIDVSKNMNSGNSSASQDSLVVEGCNPTEVIFAKNGNVATPMTIHFRYEGNAIEGVDYAPLPDSLVIPAGVKQDTLFIEAFDDGLTELNDTLRIVMLSTVTDCYTYPAQIMNFHFRDKDTLDIQAFHLNPTDSVACPGDSVVLDVDTVSGEGIISGYWTHDSTAANLHQVSVISDTTFYYIGWDECGDTLTTEVDLYLEPYTPMEYTQDTVQVCPGDSGTFFVDISGGTAPTYFTWSDGIVTNPRTFSALQDTNYFGFLQVDACGEQLADSVLLIRMPAPTAGFNYLNDPYVPLRVDFEERANNAVQFYWTVEDTNYVSDEFAHNFSAPGEYTVSLVVTSDFGCVDSVSLNVVVETDFYLYIPTAFTPNHDGINDCFRAKGVGLEGFEMQVFDRWGNMVYQSNSIDECWDGTYNGRDLPNGAYTYKIFVRLPFDKIHMETGILNIFR